MFIIQRRCQKVNLMAVFSRSTQHKTRILRSSRTARERQKPFSKQKPSSRNICSYPSNDAQKNICTHISAKKVLPNLKKALRNKLFKEEFKIYKEVEKKKIKRSTRTNNNVHDKSNQIEFIVKEELKIPFKSDAITKTNKIEPKVKEEFKTSKEVEKKETKRITRQNVNTPIKDESESQVEKTSGKTIRYHESIPPFIHCGISNEPLHELRKTSVIKKSKKFKTPCTKQECLRTSSKRKTLDKQFFDHPKSSRPPAGTEIQSSLIKTRTQKNVEVHETKHLDINTYSKKKHPQGFKEIPTKDFKMAKSIDRNIQILTRNRNCHKFKEIPYKENLKESKPSFKSIQCRLKRDSEHDVHTSSSALVQEFEEVSPEKILKSSRRQSLRSDAPNTLIANKSIRQRFTMIKEVMAEEKYVTRSTHQNVNTHCKNEPASKIEKIPTRRKSRNTEFISQNVCSSTLGESLCELEKISCIKELKMSKSRSPNKITRSKSVDELKEIPFHKTTTIFKSNGKAMHTHSICEIQENLIETESENKIKEYESKNSDFDVAVHPHFKKECPEVFQNIPQKKKFKTERSYSYHTRTRSRSESFHPSNACFTRIKESQTSKLTVPDSTLSENRSHTESKYYSDVKSANKIKTHEASCEKSVSSAEDSLNSTLTVTESTSPHTRRSKSKYSLVAKSTSKVSMKTPESVNSNDPTASETESSCFSNSSETGNKEESVNSNDPTTSETESNCLNNASETGNKENTTSIFSNRKQVTIDRSILKEELLNALKRSVENTASEELQPSSSSETPVFKAPTGEKLKELEMSIKCAAEKAIANVDPADCQNFMLEIDYFNLTFFVAMVFNQCGEENGN